MSRRVRMAWGVGGLGMGMLFWRLLNHGVWGNAALSETARLAAAVTLCPLMLSGILLFAVTVLDRSPD